MPQPSEQEALQQALALLDAALASYDARREQDLVVTNEMEIEMGQTVQTRGCGKCGGTMYRVVETDSQGNPTNATLFVCNSPGCGHMEG